MKFPTPFYRLTGQFRSIFAISRQSKIIQNNIEEKAEQDGDAPVAALLKATYAQEDKTAMLAKAEDVERKLRGMRFNSAADVYSKGAGETLAYLNFPRERCATYGRTTSSNGSTARCAEERGWCFPDGDSALMLVCARLKHVAPKEWGARDT